MKPNSSNKEHSSKQGIPLCEYKEAQSAMRTWDLSSNPPQESQEGGHLVSHSLGDKAQVIKQTVVASTEAPALRMWRQKDKKFKPSLGYLQNHASEKENQRNENKVTMNFQEMK